MSTRESRYWDARNDAIAEDQAERESAQLRADHRGFEVGDWIHITDDPNGWAWKIEGFSEANGWALVASLYERRAVDLDQITSAEED